MNQRHKDICHVAFGFFGKDHQINKAVEEMSELTLVLMHMKDGRDIPEHELVTELADVRIMLEQMFEIVGKDKVEAEIENKINRLENRIKNNGR